MTGDIHVAEIRELAKRFSADQIEHCMELVLQQQDNPCFDTREAEEAMNVLAKAEFVKSQMERGDTLAEAMRELGRRIRAAQGEG